MKNTIEISPADDTSGDAKIVQEISNWLIEQGLTGGEFEEILSGFCERISAVAGVPIRRAMMAMRTLHPSVEAKIYIWNRGEEFVSENFGMDGNDGLRWRKSPVFHMLAMGENTVRRRLDDENSLLGFLILEELKERGDTDYLARMTPFTLGGVRSVKTGLISSWTTDLPGGFSDHDVAILERLIPRLALTAKTLLTQEIAENVLDTYVGPDAGRRIMAGDIHRGSLDVIRAVLIYADLRGFTSLTDTLEREQLGPMLDAYFDQMVPPVIERGGQVLKFMGDGLLATINLEDQSRDVACRVALQAALEALQRVEALNEERKDNNLPVMELDIALHLGDVLYGNVGAADRQDFTVIGPAVNEASRIEFLCQQLGHNLLVSETFAQAATACEGSLISVGSHALRGVRRAQELYTVDLSNGFTLLDQTSDPAGHL